MKLKVKEVAELVGISVRTLHHYDQIGLLSPSEKTAAGYRLYSEENLASLQQILFFRELDFPLNKIKEIMEHPTFNHEEALQTQRHMLVKKRENLDTMINTIDKTLQHSKGEIQMTNKEKFAGFDFGEKQYEKEARERWGDKAVDHMNNKSASDKNTMSEQMNAIYRRLAELRDMPAHAETVQAEIKKWHEFLNKETGHHYSLDAFKGLGQMYIGDERFTKNIDQFGEGLAAFMSEAMAIYVDNRK